VTLDASVPEITQPGTLTAALTLGTDTPYPVAPVDVTLTVKPPKTWGKIAGTVTSASGTPIAGATVQINTWATSYTLKTDKNGQYALWLDAQQPAAGDRGQGRVPAAGAHGEDRRGHHDDGLLPQTGSLTLLTTGRRADGPPPALYFCAATGMI
jgi:hypothetical protein